MKRTLLALLGLLFFGLTMHAQTQILAPMPPHASVFSGNVRGYYFVAPSCFTITGLQLPAEAGGGLQNVAVLRFPATPPTYSATTNTFETLYLTQNNPTAGILPVNIQVEQGDIIGVLGQAGTTNSYGNGSVGTTIEGFAVPLYRLGMQFSLSTTAPQQLWTETSTNISRVNLYYDSLLTFTATYNLVTPGTFNFITNADTSFNIAWDFGDGSPLDTTPSPIHTYASQGQYNACAYITTTCATDTICFTVSNCIQPVAGFGVAIAGMTVTLTDSSTSADSTEFDFGVAVSAPGPTASYTYAVPDTYLICQTATNFCNSDNYCEYVVVCAPPTAYFAADASFGGGVYFTDSSTYVTSYWYDFGDGTTDSIPSPYHTYAASGTYDVCLITSNLCGADTFCLQVNVCLNTPTAAFSSTDSLLNVVFSNGSTDAISYSWTFGDGNSDTTASPSHTYSTDGTYVVCLTATNLCGDSSTVCDSVTVTSVSITGAMPGFSVQVAPNPMNEQAQILVHSEGVATTYSFRLMDLTGRVVATVDGKTGEVQTLVRNGWAAGVYAFQILTEGNILANGRLIVQ